MSTSTDVVPGVLPELENQEDVERRRLIKKAQKNMEALRETLGELELLGSPKTLESLAALDAEIESKKPPEPRRCKEYLRALSRAKKGLLGIAPEHVVLYCRCFECSALRAKEGLEQPATRPIPQEIVEADQSVATSA
ncbi:MAG: hypothetical protein U1E65_09255 [Myxococcota bacterium]